MNNGELNTYMGGAINRLITSAFKSTLTNPRQTAFLLRYALASRKAKMERQQHEAAGRHIPAFLIASITGSCNLRCKGCYALSGSICKGNDVKKPLSGERFYEIFREAKDLGVSFILLAGGEPMLRKEVILKAVAVPDVIFPIFTNGTLIDAEAVALFRKSRNLIPVISLEGDEQSTDARRGQGTYRAIEGAFSKLKQAKIFFGASLTVTTENVREVCSDSFIGSLHQSGCRIIFFIEYVPVDGASGHLAPTEEARVYVAERQQELRKQYKNIIFLSFPGDEQFLGGCLAAGRGFFHIGPYGDAEPCPFSPYSDVNLSSGSLLDALQSPLFRKLKQLEFVGGEHVGGCALFAHEAQIKELCGKE